MVGDWPDVSVKGVPVASWVAFTSFPRGSWQVLRLLVQAYDLHTPVQQLQVKQQSDTHFYQPVLTSV